MSQTILPADLGRIFADPAAYADPVAWHEAARQLRQEAPISRVSLPEYQDFWAITRHADIMEIERNSAVFTNAPIPTILPRAAYAGPESQHGTAGGEHPYPDGRR